MLRVLATWDPKDLPRAEAVEDPQVALELGLVPGIDAAGVFAQRWDGPLDDEPLPVGLDCGWIGEDARGVWLKRHPLTEISLRPELQDVVTEYRHGRWRITAKDYETRSNFELQAKVLMSQARARRIRRGMRPKETGDGG